MIDFALSPLTWLLAGCAGLLWLRRRSFARRVAGVLAAISLVAMTPLGANALVGLVESRAPTDADCAGPTPSAIVVLGGGLDHRPRDTDDVGALSAASLRRLLAGASLYRQHPDTHLYLTGASLFDTPESVLYEDLAHRLGVPAEAITLELTATTTWENAHNLKALTQPPPARIWLVTSALHAARAQLAFRAAGFEPCMVISDRDYLPPGDLAYFLPRTSALRKADAAIHEIVGDLAYRWRAWRSTR